MKRLILCLCCLTLTACQSQVPQELPVLEEIPMPQEDGPTIPPITPNFHVEMPDKPEFLEETEENNFLDLLPEAKEGFVHLEKLGFEPFLFEWYLPVCVVGNGTVCYSGFTSDAPLWTGDVFHEDDSTFEIFSDDLVYFYHESGEKYQLTVEGFLLLP